MSLDVKIRSRGRADLVEDRYTASKGEQSDGLSPARVPGQTTERELVLMIVR